VGAAALVGLAGLAALVLPDFAPQRGRDRQPAPATPPASDSSKRDSPEEELRKLEGHWKVVRYEQGGKDKTDYEKKWNHKGYFDIDLYVITYLGAEPIAAFNITLDPTKRPKAINLKVINRPGETPARLIGKTLLGIYELDGDNLKLCWASPGEKRPEQFSPKGGVDDVLAVYEREK
jgi:uncharacterized protein (TIGR03067 family)